MSNRILLTLILCAIMLFSCNVPQDKAITKEDKAAIEKEITTMVDSIAMTASQLRTDYFKKVYWNDPQFIGIDLTGAKGYDAYMKETDEMYAGMKSINFMEDDVSVVVFDDKTAVALFKGKAEGESKDGVIMKLNNFYASMVFRNVDGKWKVAYTHESAEQEIMMPEVDSTMNE